MVHEAIPLKQGLKQFEFPMFYISVEVHEAIPLKQGLKLWDRELKAWTLSCSRGNSIKTRIET